MSLNILNIFKKKNTDSNESISPNKPTSYDFGELNERQIEAVVTTEGYVRVIAGAGSGKTKTLASRYAYIVNKLGISPSNILSITFTNKAAQEMRARVRKLVNSGNVNDFICTYHGFCVKLLREDIHNISYPSDFIVMDGEDQKSVLKEVFDELQLTQSDITYKKVLNSIAEWKSHTPYIERLILNSCDTKLRNEYINNDSIEWNIFIRYIQKQKKGFILDFDDLILFALHILKNHNIVLEKWQRRLDYIMVDETQDNNTPQWMLVELLQAKHKNLFVVGDPDQSIYEWRGAKINGFLRFDEKYNPCKTIYLNQNYRSTPDILNVANNIIRNNKIRLEKDLFTLNLSNCKVTHFHGKTEEEEGSYIAKTIIDYIENGGDISDVAILFRASYISRFIEQALIKHKLSYVVYGGVRFFERREIKDSLAYLRMINGVDDLSFKRIINTPSRKLGKVFMANLSTQAELDNKSLYETLKHHINDPRFNRSGANEFIKLIESSLLKVEKLSISDTMQYLLEASGLIDEIRREGDQARVENIKDLIASMLLYEKDNENEDDLSLTKYLQDIALYTNVDYKEDVGQVKLMTIHQAKGLEFPVVFVAGLYEGTFPSHRTIRESKEMGLEEERRLVYVAITRAEKLLYLTDSEGYNFQTGNIKYPSRFIFEIKANLLVTEGVITKQLKKQALQYISSNDEVLLAETLCVAPQDAVLHEVFGDGIVLDINSNNGDISVQFDRYEEPKHFAARIASRVLTIKSD